ncbi:MAG: efflux RND transporter periplasmic adaptor subunit [Alphaproteobacteria bacterium]|nr:efflux RND transporter periplasmic adaptor subunit [Alphaproteobacteria bacterium]
MRTRTVVVAIAALAALGLVYRMSSPDASKGGQPARNRAETVVVAPVRTASVPLEANAVGTVQATATVAVRPRIDGEVTGVHFREGDVVAAGDLLFSLDSRGPDIQVRQAEAALARDQASLANARREKARYEQLVAQNAAARQKLEETTTNAAVLEATVRADEAALASARLQLGYTRVTAPIAGRTGAVSAYKGNVVKAAEGTAMVTIRQISPIDVQFALPQKILADLRAAKAREPVAVAVTIPGDSGGPVKGTLSFIDNVADPDTGTISLKAAFANDEPGEDGRGGGRLWPGQTVGVVVTLRTDEDAVVVPADAVLLGQAGPNAFVLKPDSTVEMRPVVLQRRWNGLGIVESGLAAGEQVVVDGQFRLTPGARVEVKEAAPAAPVGTPP